MGTKVKELDNHKHGDRRQCVLCNPPTGRITEDRLWRWAMGQTPPVQPMRP